jgi:hypothetical protein
MRGGGPNHPASDGLSGSRRWPPAQAALTNANSSNEGRIIQLQSSDCDSRQDRSFAGSAWSGGRGWRFAQLQVRLTVTVEAEQAAQQLVHVFAVLPSKLAPHS